MGICWGKQGDRERLVYLMQTQKNYYSVNEIRGYDWKDEVCSTFLSKDGWVSPPKVHKVVPSPGEDSLNHIQGLSCSNDLSRLLVYQEAKGIGRVRQLRWETSASDVAKGEHGQLVEEREWVLPTGSWVSSLLVSDAPRGPAWIALRQQVSTTFYRWDQDSRLPARTYSVKGNIFNLAKGTAPNEILGISDFDGRNEIWAFDTSRPQLTKKVGLLGGAHAFARVEASNDFVLASYEQGGYDIAETTSLPSRPLMISGTVPADTSPMVAEAPQAISAPHEYTPWETLYPRAWVPNLLFVPNGVQFGAWIPGFDISEKNYYNIYGGYDTRGLPFADFAYGYRFAGKFSVDTDLFYAPTYIISNQAFLKEWGGSIGFSFSPTARVPALTVGPIFRRLEESAYGPADQQIGIQASLTGSIGRVDQRPLDISPRLGTVLTLTHSQYLTGMGSYHNFFSTVAEIDQSTRPLARGAYVLLFHPRRIYRW